MFIYLPNIPTKKVTLAIADDSNLSILPKNINIIPTAKIASLPNAICRHADLQVHHLGGNVILSAPECFDYYNNILSSKGFKIIKGYSSIGGNYPNDIAYNITRIGNFAFHNTRYTDMNAVEFFKSKHIKLIHTNQGYSKCNAAIISENALITSDVSIHNTAISHSINSLLIEPGHVELPEYDYGFFGGCAFLINHYTLFVTGSIKTHPSKQNIYDFLEKYNIGLIEATTCSPIDIGSVICIA